MKKNGFTLIELLAVIIVLSVIALITTPIVMNYIEDSKKESFRIGTEHLITAMKNDQANQEFIAMEYQFPLDKTTTLDMQGNTANWKGHSRITDTGNIEFAIFNGTYCAYKHLTDDEATIEKTTYQACMNFVP